MRHWTSNYASAPLSCRAKFAVSLPLDGILTTAYVRPSLEISMTRVVKKFSLTFSTSRVVIRPQGARQWRSRHSRIQHNAKLLTAAPRGRSVIRCYGAGR